MPAVAETYVSHGPTTETRLLSILCIHHCLETMPPFLHDVRSKRSRGPSTGPEGRANVGRPFVIEHLKRAVSFGNKWWSQGTTDVSSCSFR